MRYAYYPGCSLKGTALDYHASTMALAGRLGIELAEMEDWVCCGASPIHQRNPVMAAGVSNLLLSLSSGISNQIAVLCAACYHNMKKAEEEMRRDGAHRNEIEKLTGIRFDPEVRTRHFLDILDRDLGAATLKEKVVRPLEGLRVACYYGCLLTRPPIVAFDDPEVPSVMERVLAAAGAETVSWTHRQECCGASHAVPLTDSVLRLVNDILTSARDAGAEILACACPLCQANLDMRQAEVTRKYGVVHDLPAVYFTQLLGIACGASGQETMIGKGIVSAEPLLRFKNLL
ncbi:MAG: CoB--CoM heterodisulfide reductase iron-sulfur subunit B family protein [bacterium]